MFKNFNKFQVFKTDYYDFSLNKVCKKYMTFKKTVE